MVLSPPFLSSRTFQLRARAARALAAAIATPLLALTFAASAEAAAAIDMGEAHEYSVLGDTVTSTGVTAMSDSLGADVLSGSPIVLGETNLGADDDGPKAAMSDAYAEAMLAPSDETVATLDGRTFTPGVYTVTGAAGLAAAGTMTLDGAVDDVFIFQIGGALTTGANAEVILQGGVDPCNVFWQINGAATVGAGSKLAGTFMTSADVVMGASARVDGRLLSAGNTSLDSSAVRTACTDTVIVPGPAGPTGPAGPAGADGDDGAAGASGPAGADGDDGAAGASGADGAPGPAGTAGSAGAAGTPGAEGAAGSTGLTGIAGIFGPTGAQGPMGATGPTGPAGLVPQVTTTRLCVTNRPNRHAVRRRQSVRWTIVVRNCGAHVATSVKVSNSLRDGARFKALDGGKLVRRQLRWNVGTLAPGARTAYEVVTRFDADPPLGSFVNSVRADGDNTPAKRGHGSVTVKRT